MRVSLHCRCVVTALLLAFAATHAPGALADPWKDESGKGRQHEGKGRGKHEDKGRERLEKYLRKVEERREKAERKRDERERGWREERERATRALVEVRRPRAASATPRPVAVRRPATVPVRQAAAPVRAAAPTVSVDARRRAAVQSYMARHPGG